MFGQDGRLSDEDADDESAENRMHSDVIGHERHHHHQKQDGGDDRHVNNQVVVSPANDVRDDAASEGETDGEKRNRSEKREAHVFDINAAARSDAADDGDDDPADSVVQNYRSEDNLPDVASKDSDLHDY